MQKTTGSFGPSLAVLLIVLTGAKVVADDSQQRRPNFIIFFTDDQGYADVGCFGATDFQTPNFDRLAAEGLKLTSFYAQPVCGPSRAALMTGCYPMRIGEPGNVNHSHTVLHPKEITIAEVLQTAGYKTACIGKWHCGDQAPDIRPNAQGFDYFFGSPKFNGFTPRVAEHAFRMALMENEDVVKQRCEQQDMDQVTTWYTERAVKYIAENKATPFFLYLAHNMPHVPLGVSDKFKGSTSTPYGDVIQELDWSMGQILKTLEECGIDQHTLVIFTSDNGPWQSPRFGQEYAGSARPLKGAKMETWEGGPRVPCIMRWPGVIEANRASNGLCTTMDLLPTLASLAGTSPPDDRIIDGKDLSAFLRGEVAETPNDVFYFYAHSHLQAVRDKHWKLVLPRGDGTEDMSFWRGHTTAVEQLQLFSMDDDKEERSNVADDHPEVVARLLKQIDEGREDIGDYDRTGNGARFWATRFCIETPKQTYERLKRLERTTGQQGLYGRYVGNFPYGGLASYGPHSAKKNEGR
jgi:arylsulfatase A-like enzyme